MAKSREINYLEDTFELILKEKNILNYRREYRFHSVRKFRFDFAFPQKMIAIEIQGLLYKKMGGHQTVAGIMRDCEKNLLALQQGWTVISIPGPWVINIKYWPFIEDILKLITEKQRAVA